MHDKKAALEAISASLRADAANGVLPLGASADDIVPGEGNESAEIVCIGEAPGFHESVQHRPFVGRSGQLFRETIKKVGIPDTQVYITNIVKVRPPDNRDPFPDEIAAFRPYLDQEISLIEPKLIVTLGRFSMSKFLRDVKISQVHGRLHKVQWQGKTIFVMPMYHPAAALRSTQVTESFKADFEKLPKVLQWIANHGTDEHWKDEVKASLL